MPLVCVGSFSNIGCEVVWGLLLPQRDGIGGLSSDIGRINLEFGYRSLCASIEDGYVRNAAKFEFLCARTRLISANNLLSHCESKIFAEPVEPFVFRTSFTRKEDR